MSLGSSCETIKHRLSPVNFPVKKYTPFKESCCYFFNAKTPKEILDLMNAEINHLKRKQNRHAKEVASKHAAALTALRDNEDESATVREKIQALYGFIHHAYATRTDNAWDMLYKYATKLMVTVGGFSLYGYATGATLTTLAGVMATATAAPLVVGGVVAASWYVGSKLYSGFFKRSQREMIDLSNELMRATPRA